MFLEDTRNIYALDHYNTIEILYSYNTFEITIWCLEKNVGRLHKVTSSNFLSIIAFLHLFLHYRNKSLSFLLTRLEMEGLSSASYLQPLTMATGMRSDLPITSSAADAISSAVAISVTFNFFPYISIVPT